MIFMELVSNTLYQGCPRGFVPCSFTLQCSGQLLSKTLVCQRGYKLQTSWRIEGALSYFPPNQEALKHLKTAQMVLLRTLKKVKGTCPRASRLK